MVGQSGRVYALDIHPLALQTVQKIALKQGLSNVETILSDGDTGLPDNSVDLVMLYDVFHGLDDPHKILAELHRVLKSQGLLSFSDHHLKEEEILSRVGDSGFFSLLKKGQKTYCFLRMD